jgi:hypothetical protein
MASEHWGSGHRLNRPWFSSHSGAVWRSSARIVPATAHHYNSVAAPSVVEKLDVIKHISPRFVPYWIDPSFDPLVLERLEEALGNGAVMAAPPAVTGVGAFPIAATAWYAPTYSRQQGFCSRACRNGAH